MPEYKSLDCETLPDETQAGGVKHNKGVGLETGDRPLELQARLPGATEPTATMPNDLLIQPGTESQAAMAGEIKLDIRFGIPIEERPIWVELYESIRDVFFPPKLPPLKLTSKPIPVPDRLAVKRNPWAVGISAGVNVAILSVVIYVLGRAVVKQIHAPSLTAAEIDVGDFKAPKSSTQAGGGGGGGDHSVVDASKGKLPKIEKTPVTPPQIQTVKDPIIPMQAAINVQKDIALPDNPLLPNLGVKDSVNVKLASNGEGGGGGMGAGHGGGLGSGNGNGYGMGFGGNIGGGLYQVGGNISAPVQLNVVEAEFSDEARRNKYQGVCIVQIIVDTQGNPQNPRVVRALGMGLDEKAIEAVMKYKFRPAMKDRKTPVAVMVDVEVNFHMY
jgi:TonB family protein